MSLCRNFYRVTDLRLNRWYIIFYHFWFWILVTGFVAVFMASFIFFFNAGIVPFVILAVINMKIFAAMQKLKKRLKKSTKRNVESGIGLLAGKALDSQEKAKLSAAGKMFLDIAKLSPSSN